LSQGETSPQPERSSPGVPAASSSQRPSIARPLAGCPLAAPPQAATPLDRSGLRPAHVAAQPICSPAFQPWGTALASPAPDLLCRLLTSAGRSGRIPPPSVPCQDTPQLSRGQLSYRRCLDAGCSKYAPLWMEDFVVACPLVPSVPHLVSSSCPSPRTFVPRVLRTPPHGDALALPLSFGSTHTWTGDFHPQA
jgi:hypothetical protein